MNVISRYSVFTIMIFFLARPLSIVAGEKGYIKDNHLSGKSDIAAKSIQTNCYESSKYFVIAKEHQGEVGTDLLIKYKLKPNEKLLCNYIFENNDLEIKNEWAEYFAGLKGDFLILDSTTGPGPSGLIIWDLIKRKKAYEGAWSDPEESDYDSLVYWTETEEASDDNCPELKGWRLHGLGGAIETKVILNLSNFKILKTQEKRCTSRQ